MLHTRVLILPSIDLFVEKKNGRKPAKPSRYFFSRSNPRKIDSDDNIRTVAVALRPTSSETRCAEPGRRARVLPYRREEDWHALYYSVWQNLVVFIRSRTRRPAYSEAREAHDRERQFKMTTTTTTEPSSGSLQHLPPRKRLLAQMMAQGGTDAHSTENEPLDAKKALGVSAVVPPPEVMHVLHEKNKKPRPMIPESDVIKAARARAAAAGAEQPAVVVSTAAQELKASAKAKGERAAAARRAAVAEAAKAKAAAAKAGELARLAEEAKAVAAELEKARASRAEKDEREKPNLDDVASDELARRVHSEMNASPRLSRGGERAAASPSAVVAPPA